jgi:hypothetical protein
MEYTTTPVYAGVFSVIRPRPCFSTWLPYKNCISFEGFTHICKARARFHSVCVSVCVRVCVPVFLLSRYTILIGMKADF